MNNPRAQLTVTTPKPADSSLSSTASLVRMTTGKIRNLTCLSKSSFPAYVAIKERKRQIRRIIIHWVISVWRPLKPTDDWPLALCDYTTIDTEEDIRLNDAIRRDLIGEGLLLHYNEDHKWYYFKDQGVNDLIVFRNSDSHGKRAREWSTQTYLPRYNVSWILVVVSG